MSGVDAVDFLMRGNAGTDTATPVPRRQQVRQTANSVPWIAIISAIGVLIIAFGFDRGRAGEPGAAPLYWIGETIVLGVPCLFLINKRAIGLSEGRGIALIVAVATYAIKLCYQPLQFTFSDEFQHVSTIQPILSSHHLFHANPNLTVSPYYPGLEIQTSSVVSMSHLSLYASASVVLGLAHLVTTLALFLLASEIVGRPRVAALAVVIFAMGGNYQFFTDYFAYESLGLPLVIVSLLATVKAVKADERRTQTLWLALAIACGLGTAVTHHVSSYVLVGMELAIAGVSLFSGESTRPRVVATAIAAASVTFVVLWDLAVATPTYSYLVQAFSGQFAQSNAIPQIGSAVSNVTGGAYLTLSSVSKLPPPFQHYMGYVWALLLTALITWGVWLVLRLPVRENRLLWAMALLAPGVLVAFALQVLAPGGAQVGTRLLTFILIPGSIVSALAIDSVVDRRRQKGRHSKKSGTRRSKVVMSVLVVPFVVGAISLGFPPFYAVIPGPYLLGGRSRSVDSYDVLAAVWAGDDLPPGNRFAADVANAELIGSIGNQLNVSGFPATLLILTSALSPTLDQAVRQEYLVFVVADSRISRSVPVAGNPIFPNDPFTGHYARPIPAAGLDKFDTIAGVSRMYDNGPIVIYSLKGSVLAPAPEAK